MAKTRAQKEAAVADLVTTIKESKAAVFASFTNVTVADAQQLRRDCRANGVEYVVAKKRLMNIAFKNAGFDDVDTSTFEGNVAVAFGMNDEVASAKTLNTFAKAHEGFQLLGGILEGRYIDAAQVKSLAQLPSREELLAKMVGSLQAPISGLVNVLSGVPRSLVTVLSAIKDAKA